MIRADIVGTVAGPIAQAIDARWLMAYAAALGETDPRCFDTLAPEGPLPHPLFPVCYEWPAAVALREKTVPVDLLPRGVHASHHLVIHRLPRAATSVRTTARVIAVEPRRSGTLVVTRFDTVDSGGNPITTTDYGAVFRGVPLAGDSRVGAETPLTEGGVAAGGAARPPAWGSAGAPVAPPPSASRVRWTALVEVTANAAHVYTECARIWNPIHTDVAVARGAGLSGAILHGTATLALAVSRVVAHELDGEPTRVAEIHARFSGMVPLPSSFTVRGRGHDGRRVTFDAVGPDGEPVLSEGVVIACDR